MCTTLVFLWDQSEVSWPLWLYNRYSMLFSKPSVGGVNTVADRFKKCAKDLSKFGILIVLVSR